MTDRSASLPRIAIVILGILFLPALLLSQTVAWKFPIKVVDNTSGAVSVVWLGVHPSATGCANASAPLVFGSCDTVVENFLPPVFNGVMDARFLAKKAGDDCLDQGTDKLIKPYLSSTDIDTATLGVTATAPNSDPFTISWPAGLSAFATSMIIKDGINATYIADMKSVTSLFVDDGTFTKFRIIISGPKAVTVYPAPPVLSTPANNATDQDTSATLTWGAEANSKTYHLQVSFNDINFNPANLIFDSDTSATSIKLHKMKGNKLYYWQVRGQNDFFTGCYSAPFVFRTIATQPDTPKPKAPAVGAINVSPNTAFSWTSVVADSFELQVSTNNFTSVLKDTTVKDSSVTLSLSNCVTYYWKVQAKAGSKVSGFFFPVRSFTTQSAVPSPPTLVLPSNNGTVNVSQPTLTWTGDACSNTYHVQLALDAGFTNIVLEQTGAQTSAQTPALIGQTDYFWHVNAINATAGASAYAATRKFTTGVLPPTVPVLVTPASGSTTNLSPTLVWNKSFNTPTTYHLQVDTSSKFSNPFINDSSITDTTKALSSLQNCSQYYWRVSAKNAAGVSAYAASFTFKTPVLVPDTPTPSAPANLDTVKTAQVTISWTSGDICSKRFVLILTTDTASATVLRHDTLSAVSELIGSLSGETKYFWKVASINSNSQLSSYTSWQEFITGPFLPGTPVLVSPANGATLNANTVVFKWNKSSNNARTYRLEISLVNTFATLVYDNSSLSDTTVSIDTIKHCDQYFWRVSATNPAGTTAFSGTSNFNSEQAIPLGPTLVSPANGADHQLETPTLSWVPNDSCATKYVLEVAKDPNIDTLIERDTVTTWSKTLTKHLASASVNYWRVTALNGLGGGASAISQFTVTPLTTPDSTTLLLPHNGDRNVVLSPVLTWNKSTRATSYRLQVALDSNFSILVFDDSTITDTTKTIGPLLNSKTFYWHVDGKNGVGTSKYSAVFNFTTLAPPAAPTLIDPTDHAVYVDVTPVFSWSISSGAVTYSVEVATDSLFRGIVFSDSNITITSRQIPDQNKLDARTVYYWHVRGKNEAGYGSFSAFRQFKTTPTGPSNWMMALSVSETGPAHDSVYFGVNNSATFGIDPGLDEYELPPPSFGQFDARFTDLKARPGLLGQGVRVDVEPFFNYRQNDTFHLSFQPGTGSYPITIGWHNDVFPQICDSIIIQDTFNGVIFRDRMDTKESYVISDQEISSVYIIIFGTFPLGVDDRHQPGYTQDIPKGYQLYQNYPNPFNPTTMISFSTERATQVQLGVYDVLGRQIAVLANGTYSPGIYTMSWNGKNSNGTQMPSGVYYARIIMNGLTAVSGGSDHYMFTRKMLMLK